MSGNQDQLYPNPGNAPQGDGYQGGEDVELTAARQPGNVRVVHGVNDESFPNLEGKTVGFVKKNLRDVFNIPGDAEALVNGNQVGDDFVLQGGTNLEFVKEAGVKGKGETCPNCGAGLFGSAGRCPNCG